MANPELFILTVDVPLPLADAVSSRLFDAGLRGLEEQDSDLGMRLVTYGDDETQIKRYAQLAHEYLSALSEFEPTAHQAKIDIKVQRNSQWSTSWMKYFKPTPVTDSIIVQPSWEKSAPPAGKKLIIIEPKMAFGFGTHATTRLASRAIERYCLAYPGRNVLDVGTGTGILALVAAVSGAKRALGLDHDLVAVEAARENAELNGLSALCSFSDEPVESLKGQFDLVAANINAPTLTRLAETLAHLLAPEGRLAITGILTISANEVAAAFEPHGLRVVDRDMEEEWTLLELTRA